MSLVWQSVLLNHFGNLVQKGDADCHAMEAEWLAMTEIDYTGRKEPGVPKGWKDYCQSYLS